MSKLVTILLMILLSGEIVFAQQRPHYTQYMENMSVLNPAVTGMYNGLDLRLGIRSQWQGLQNAPKTGYITFSTPFSLGGDMANYRASDLGVKAPQSKDETFDYTASMSHHSIGLTFLSDKTGPLNRVTGDVTYAYHLSVGDAANLSVGVGVGVNRLSLDAQSLVFDQIGDPVIGTSAEINKYTPDLNVGLYFYTSTFYFGASMQQVIKNKLAFDGGFNTGNEVGHYFITTGYKFWFNNDFNVTPSVMLKMVSPLPKAFDLNMKVGYRDTFWLSGGYRKNDAFFGGFGFNVAEMVGINYAFDRTISELNTVSSGSHELTLRVSF